jgi:hypothetical protein
MKYFKLFEQFVNELTQTPVSGTRSGWTTGLEDRKYELKKDVKGAQIGDFVNVLLPKGTIIYNLPGGLFADHFSLKNKYASRSNRGPQWFDKPTFNGIQIRQKPDVLKDIEKHSKVLESARIKGDQISESVNESKEIDKKLARLTLNLLVKTGREFSQTLYLNQPERGELAREFGRKLPRGFANQNSFMMSGQILSPLAGDSIYQDGNELVKGDKTIMFLKGKETWADVAKKLKIDESVNEGENETL